MRILTRYLLRLHVAPFIFALSVLTGLLFVNAVARRLGDLAGKGLDIRVILEVMVLSLPHILALTFPMAVLVAVLYAFSQLAAENEIAALKATGTNLVRLTVPLIVTSVLFAGFMVWFNDSVLPETNHSLKNLMADVARKSPTFQLKEQVINSISTGDTRRRYFLQAGRIDHETNRLWDVTIYDMSQGNRIRSVYADSALMAFNAEQTSLLLTLYDGWSNEAESSEPNKFQRVVFEKYWLEMEGIGDQFERIEEQHRSDREMSFAMLRASADTFRTRLDSVRAAVRLESEQTVRRILAGPGTLDLGSVSPFGDKSTLSVKTPLGVYRASELEREWSDEIARRAALEVRVLRQQAADLSERVAARQVEAHKKFAIPFASIVFVLIGAPLAIRFPRGGVGMVIGFSLVIFGIYYVSLIGGEYLGDRRLIAPFWGPWAPNIVFFALGVVGMTKIGQETSSTRGGGWDDLWLTLRRPFMRRRRPASPR